LVPLINFDFEHTWLLFTNFWISNTLYAKIDEYCKPILDRFCFNPFYGQEQVSVIEEYEQVPLVGKNRSCSINSEVPIYAHTPTLLVMKLEIHKHFPWKGCSKYTLWKHGSEQCL